MLLNVMVFIYRMQEQESRGHLRSAIAGIWVKWSLLSKRTTTKGGECGFTGAV